MHEEPTSVELRFSDHDIVPVLYESPPPESVVVGDPRRLIEAGEDCGGLFLSVLISFPAGVASSLVASWFWDRMKNSGKPHTTINKEKVILEETEVVRFFEKTITRQYSEDREWRNDDQ